MIARNLTLRKRTTLKILNCKMMALLLLDFPNNNLESADSELSFIKSLNIIHLRKSSI